MSIQKQICTPFELKQFAGTESNPTPSNFAKFIESKSDFKYTVIEMEFIRDTFKTLKEYATFSSNLNKDL